MAILFVHGVPDTAHVWESLVRRLAFPKDAVKLMHLPGFGCPIPAGFTATKEAYLEWLVQQAKTLYDQDGPLDIVAHDWGGILALRMLGLHRGLFRRWVLMDAPVSPDYQWHGFARIWQTPIIGEIFMSMMRGPQLRWPLQWLGLPSALAKSESVACDRRMRQSILSLYRSAKAVTQDWNDTIEHLPEAGLIICGEHDPYVPLVHHEWLAKRANVPLHVEQGAGHWAFLEHEASVAEQLKTFLA